MENSPTEVRSKSSKGSIEFHSGLASSIKGLDKCESSSSLKVERNVNHLKEENDHDNQRGSIDSTAKVPNKIISNWKHACDKTKDKTKDLLKRWRTLPEIETEPLKALKIEPEKVHTDSGWSVHVWTTWVDRYSVESSDVTEQGSSYQLTSTQNNKFSHFFSTLLDRDQDDLIWKQDFETLIERFRHFADWSLNSAEFNTLREVERGFIETFLVDISNERWGFQLNNETYLTKEGWLQKWGELLCGSKNLNDFPVWLQVFSKVLFQVMNKSGSGIVTRDELGSFYSSVLCLNTLEVGKILDVSYQAMTSNGDHPLMYEAYRLCFANYLLGRYPNGPGEHILGTPPNESSLAMFPIDYSALNSPPEDLEQYTLDQKTNRWSVIV
ncbi:uncharacterized protein LOC123686158 [Harmonia axyridis]|uniref:uncharacterized protein LOC123686158 n=1 Tax=Harmonia axyridis TaxID=115357 RepID=UPI001E2785F9|nr:uncharacterized protein LOC123686158 [Harmonia axyridis]